MIGFRKESLRHFTTKMSNFRLFVDNYLIGKEVLSILLIIAITLFPLLNVSGQVKESPTSTTITLYWTSTGDNGYIGNAYYYNIRYSLVPINNSNWHNATKVNNVRVPRYSGASESLKVIGLTPNTTYFFAIKVGDEIPNWSELSNVAMFRTSPPPLCGDIDESGVVDITDLVYFVRYMFITSYPQFNLNAMDLDLSGGVDITDLLFFVEYLFANAPPLQCPS